MATLFFATKYFVTPDHSVDTSYISSLPDVDSPSIHCTYMSGYGFVSAAVAVGEVLEAEGQHAAAIKWAQAECMCVVQDNRNAPLKSRAGRLLGA